MSQERLAEECAKRRLQVCVASIKRAEAGKNILYRTITNLASFFNITVDNLLDNAPLALWQYTEQQAHYSIPCLGREWELQQLSILNSFILKSNKHSIACITGMKGAGKTCLIQSFLKHNQQYQQKNSYFSFDKVNSNSTESTLHRFVRAIFEIKENTADSAIRHKMKQLAQGSLVYFLLLSISGVPLSHVEKHTLSGLSPTQVLQVEAQVYQAIVKYCCTIKLAVLALDDIQDADTSCLHLIKGIVAQSNEQPLFIILGITPLDHFTALPQWLQNSHHIQLQPLDNIATLHLSQYKTDTDQRP